MSRQDEQPERKQGGPEWEEWETRTGKRMTGHRCRGRAKHAQGAQCDRRAAAGQEVCRFHGGASPQAKQAARTRLIEAKAARATRQVQVSPVTDPLTALANIAGEVLALNEFLRAEVESLNGTITYWTETSFSDAEGELRTTAVENVRAVLAAYERSLDRGVKTLATMVKLDLQGRLVAIREDEANRLVEAIRLGLADVDMPAAIRDAARLAIAERLDAVTGPRAEIPA